VVFLVRREGELKDLSLKEFKKKRKKRKLNESRRRLLLAGVCHSGDRSGQAGDPFFLPSNVMRA